MVITVTYLSSLNQHLNLLICSLLPCNSQTHFRLDVTTKEHLIMTCHTSQACLPNVLPPPLPARVNQKLCKHSYIPMASRQQPEDRAEAAAKVASKELEQVNKARDHNLAIEDQQQHDQEKRGVISSVLRAVQGTYENAKGAVVGKKDPADPYTTEVVHHVNVEDEDARTGEVRDISPNKAGSKVGEYADYASQKAKETKDATAQKAGEYTDYASQKAKEAKDKTMEKGGEYKDYAAEKAKEAKDATMNKAGEYKDYTAEKTKEGKDTTMGKLGELKDSATDAAKRAVDYLSGKKEETKEKAAETAEATKNRTSETAETAKKKATEMKDAAKEKAAETTEATKNRTSETAETAKKKAAEMKDAAKDKAAETTEATKNKTSETAETAKKKATEMKDAAKDKAAESTEAAKQKTAESKDKTKENVSGGGEEDTRRKMEELKVHGKGYGEEPERRGGDKVVLRVEESRPGAVAETLKATDQMTGQTFNDVGRMDDEGVINVERRNK
ncbi:hypothetical protein VNO77_16051 [Canavalia gladiata]|uniref:Late embryogenesis abundant protein ECP63-like domain-containing protein n=1 Tax=Canavalia gladiata TaxID=3824 RepID=A0AAN9M0C5_CANGL